jgi:hypothetical protein
MNVGLTADFSSMHPLLVPVNKIHRASQSLSRACNPRLYYMDANAAVLLQVVEVMWTHMFHVKGPKKIFFAQSSI